MSAFERWCKGLISDEPEIDEQLVHEREYILTKVYSPEHMRKRWDEINYTAPENFQLKLF